MKSIFGLRKPADSGATSADVSLETALERVVNRIFEVSLLLGEAKAVRVDLLSQDLLQHGQLREGRAQASPATRFGEIPATPKEIN